jgi:hypothetical protein
MNETLIFFLFLLRKWCAWEQTTVQSIDRNPIQDHVTPCDFEPNTEIHPLLFCNPGVGFIAETGWV